jgi:hypothetical protein
MKQCCLIHFVKPLHCDAAKHQRVNNMYVYKIVSIVHNRFKIRKLQPYDANLLKYKVPHLLQHGPQFHHFRYENEWFTNYEGMRIT